MAVHKDYYVRAAAEVAGGRIDSSLFIKALSMADGDEKKARAIYVGLRAEEIYRESRAQNVGRYAGAAVGLAAGTVAAAGAATTHVVKSEFGRTVGLAIASLVIPGSGQLQEGRKGVGMIFLLCWLTLISFGIGSIVYANITKEDGQLAAEAKADAHLVQTGCSQLDGLTQVPKHCLDAVRTARSLRQQLTSPNGLEWESVWGILALFLGVLHVAAPAEVVSSRTNSPRSE